MTALLAPRQAGQRRDWGAQLRSVVRAPSTLSGLPFVLVLAVFLAVGMVGLLLLTTTLQEQAFAVRTAQNTATQLGYQVADLEARVTQARSSTELAIKASQLGMRPNPYPAYLTLPDGKIVGDPTPVTGWELPEVRYRTPEQLQAEADARQKAAEARAKAQEAKRKADAEAKAQAAADAKAKAEAAAAKKKRNG